MSEKNLNDSLANIILLKDKQIYDLKNAVQYIQDFALKYEVNKENLIAILKDVMNFCKIEDYVEPVKSPDLFVLSKECSWIGH